MKITLCAVILTSLALIGCGNSQSTKPSHHSGNTKEHCEYGRCQAKAASTGKRCHNCVSKAGERYCWEHS